LVIIDQIPVLSLVIKPGRLKAEAMAVVSITKQNGTSDRPHVNWPDKHVQFSSYSCFDFAMALWTKGY
jgi:hypothetical protein